MVPVAEHLSHHSFNIVKILLRLQCVVNAVVALLVEFRIGDIRVVLIMRAAGGLNKSMGHKRARRNDGIHDAVLDQVGNNQTLLGDGHGTRESHHDEAIFVASHGLEHVGSFADLASGERSFRHGAHQIINRADF